MGTQPLHTTFAVAWHKGILPGRLGKLQHYRPVPRYPHSLPQMRGPEPLNSTQRGKKKKRKIRDEDGGRGGRMRGGRPAWSEIFRCLRRLWRRTSRHARDDRTLISDPDPLSPESNPFYPCGSDWVLLSSFTAQKARKGNPSFADSLEQSPSWAQAPLVAKRNGLGDGWFFVGMSPSPPFSKPYSPSIAPKFRRQR